MEVKFITALLLFSFYSCSLLLPPGFNGISSSSSSSPPGPSYYLGPTNAVSANIGALIYVPAGTFQYDSTAADICNIPVYLHFSEFDITGVQFQAVTGIADPSSFSEASHPADQVSWYQALVFCNDLSIKEGLTPVYSINGSTSPSFWGAIPSADNSAWDAAAANWSANGYRLPTEMEWMWAAMGASSDGISGDITGGVNTLGYAKGYAGSVEAGGAQVNIGSYAWYAANSGSTTHAAGAANANELGLFDMSGNLFQWCWDWYASTYTGGGITDPDYTASLSPGSYRVNRGGCWYESAAYAAVACRYYYYPYIQYYFYGFRVVRR
ncbi:MAG: SUMF1/EgtB/PvdO family nonheme iron enzyme [Brevinematales bacterium]|jgi:formylglycine-generating enzyme required for sulfatase activity